MTKAPSLFRRLVYEIAAHTQFRTRLKHSAPYRLWLRKRCLTLFARYEAQAERKRLQIGCGANLLPGWFNTDFYPKSEVVAHLDATEPFPFAAASFDAIYCAHMIEHIEYPAACAMVAQCYRVLKPGGVLRLATPNLQFLFDLQKPELSDCQRDYLKWAVEPIDGLEPGHDATFLLNRFVRAWGHLFIFDEPLLRDTLRKAGFVDIRSCGLCQSEHPDLRNLEDGKRIPLRFLELETVVLEGRKP